MTHPGRLIGKISSFVAAGAFFVLAVGAGFIPKFDSGYEVCPSVIGGVVQGASWQQNIYNNLSGGSCNSFLLLMMGIMALLALLAVIALVAAILLRTRRNAGAPAGYPAGYEGTAVGQPEQGHFSQALSGIHDQAKNWQPEYKPWTGEQPPWRGEGKAPAAGGFDTKLAVVAVAAVAGIVLVSFAVQWLSFLPGIVQLLLWTSVGLTAIWQLKRRAAGGDPVRLAEAEAWNPAVVARRVTDAGRRRLEVHRAQRREAERAQAAAAAPAAVEFAGDDGMAQPGQH